MVLGRHSQEAAAPTDGSALRMLQVVDWGATSAGPREIWPHALRTALNICVESRFPMAIFWGADHVQLYNDAYAASILRDRHPALGKRAQDSWTNIWPEIGALLDSVMRDSRGRYCEDLYLPVMAHGIAEERYFTFSFSAIRAEDGVGGVFCAATDTTARVLLEREAADTSRHWGIRKKRESYERDARIADAMQSASLPRTLPNVPRLRFDAVYVPARAEARIGGDWYDAVQISSSCVVISIGDVTGSGLKAAVTMSGMRQVIRGIAQVHADPVLILNAADKALRLEESDCLVTAFVGVLDPLSMTLVYASAGHPPPLLRLSGGEVQELDAVGLPLGLRGKNDLQTAQTILLPDESVLVLYTDGLTEVRKRPTDGFADLKASLHSDEIVRAQDPASLLKESLLPFGSHDDVAIMTIRVGDRYGGQP